MSDIHCQDQKGFWENAGRIGYDKAIFSNQALANHIMLRQWKAVVELARRFNLNKDSKIIELGCGDGKFALNVLSLYFEQIDAFDCSESAIERARMLSKKKNVSFYIEDIANYNYETNANWDAAFLMGFLHHVKSFATQIVSRLVKVCPKVIIAEPNGDNMIRKSLELLPSYRKAGEDSFRLKELINVFEANGYSLKTIKKVGFMPPFLPEILFPAFKKIENIVEPNSTLNNLCSTNILGFQRNPALNL